ncbi:PLDc N-terminal domain-containing protein [Nonomuraea sp. NPDC002799]
MAGVVIGVALLVFWIFSIFDVATTPEDEVRNVPKALWMFVVVLLPLLGGLVWTARGRPRAERAPSAVPPGAGAPKGPDDDPDFLRDLERKMRGDDLS